MAEHTPGPWRTHHVGATRVVANVPEAGAADIHTICNTWSSPLSPPRPEAEANARLIAAAPDLLAACEALHVRLFCEQGGQENSKWAAPLELLQRVIRKARGN